MSKTADFERSLRRLERIVNELQAGNLSLDEALKKYTEGIEIAKGCSKMLKAAKAKVERLVKQDEGLITTKEFQPEEES